MEEGATDLATDRPTYGKRACQGAEEEEEEERLSSPVLFLSNIYLSLMMGEGKGDRGGGGGGGVPFRKVE